MSDRVFAWLLRLYPPSFRREYVEEALDLYRARVRDETGFLLRSRLYYDLVADLLGGLPQAYRNSYARAAASLAPNADGNPSFRLLEQEPLRPESIVGGSALALAAVVVFAFAMTSPWFLPLPPARAPISPIESVMQRVNQAMSPDSAGSAQSAAAAFHLGVAAKPQTQPSTATAAAAPAQSAPLQRASVRAASAERDRAKAGGGRQDSEAASIGLVPPIFGQTDPRAQGGTSLPDHPKPPLAFEVISIRPSTGTSGPPQFGATPDGYRQINMPLFAIFQEAYAPPNGNGVLNGDRIAGGPEWLVGEHYDIVAKVSEADLADWQKPELKQTMLRTMLQSMLADRCKAVVHQESKEVPVYDLVVAKGGPKFKPAETSDAATLKQKHPGGGSMIGGGMAAQSPNDTQFYGVSMTWLAQTMLPHMAGRPVVDKTGLTGHYDLMLPPLALPPPPPPPGGRSMDAPYPPPTDDESIFTALPDALGLRLVPAKGQVDTLVIDRVEHPSQN